MQLQSAAEV
jgi:hypothetical protein